MSGAIEADPVLVGDAIGLVSQAGDVLILDAVSGSAIGRNRIGGGPGAPLAATDDTLFVASLDQSLYAFNREGGTTRWRKRTETPLRDRPVLHEGRVYCTIPDQGLTAFDAGTGEEAWSAEGVGGYVVAVRDGRPIAWDGREAVSLDPETGQVIERARLEHVDFVLTDTLVDGTLYTVSEHGVVVRFNPR
jgi:outer membrane protein assembly factor BamB